MHDTFVKNIFTGVLGPPSVPAGYVVAPPAAYPHLYQPQPVTQPQHHQLGHSPAGADAPPPPVGAGGVVVDSTRVVYSQQQPVHPQTHSQASPSAAASSGGVVARPLEIITEITQELRRDSVESSAGTRSWHKLTSLPNQ